MTIKTYDPQRRTIGDSDGNIYPFFSGTDTYPIEVQILFGFRDGRYTVQEAYDYLMTLKIVQSKYTYSHTVGTMGVTVGAETPEELRQMITEYITGESNDRKETN